jgi:hypothetical protein
MSEARLSDGFMSAITPIGGASRRAVANPAKYPQRRNGHATHELPRCVNAETRSTTGFGVIRNAPSHGADGVPADVAAWRQKASLAGNR